MDNGTSASVLKNATKKELLYTIETVLDDHRKNLLAKFEAKNNTIMIGMATHLEFIQAEPPSIHQF